MLQSHSGFTSRRCSANTVPIKDSLTEINDDIVPRAESTFSCPLATFNIDWTFLGNWGNSCSSCLCLAEMSRTVSETWAVPRAAKQSWWCCWQVPRAGQHAGVSNFPLVPLQDPFHHQSELRGRKRGKEKGHKKAQCPLLRHTNRLTLWIKDYSVWFDSAVLFNDAIKALAAACVFQYVSSNFHTPAM